jgi:hypothetical protein
MLRGVAVYANDLEFAKQAMRFDESKAIMTTGHLEAMRSRALEGIDELPSILIVRKPSSEKPQSLAQPLDLVFQGPQFFTAAEDRNAETMPWLPRRLTMLLARHQLAVGFNDKEIWKFRARAAEKETNQHAP